MPALRERVPHAVSLKIDWATHEAAEYACKHWHYSKCIPKNKLVKIGAWENDKFIGVVIFGYGATPALGKPYGLKITECCELVRVALTKHVSPVSRILSIAIRFLKKSNPGLRLIVSFADQTQGHHGGIYQATNWIYSGQTSPSVFYRDPRGKLWHPRRASPKPCPGKQLVTSSWKKELQQPKHRYLYPLDSSLLSKVNNLSQPYPKRVNAPEAEFAAAPSFQDGEGGSKPTPALQNKKPPAIKGRNKEA